MHHTRIRVVTDVGRVSKHVVKQVSERSVIVGERLGCPPDVDGLSKQYSECDLYDQCNRADDQGDSVTFEAD